MLHDNDTFIHRGVPFRVHFESDDHMGAPWDEECGHGPVREVSYSYYSKPTKFAGERVMHQDGRTAWLYDWAGAMVQAREEGWGLGEDELVKLTKQLGRTPTPGQVTERAVSLDFQRLCRWLSSDWTWVGVCVEELHAKDFSEGIINPVCSRYENAIWGIESDAGEYLDQVAHEMAEERLSGRVNEWRLQLAQKRWEREQEKLANAMAAVLL